MCVSVSGYGAIGEVDMAKMEEQGLRLATLAQGTCSKVGMCDFT